MENTEKNIVSFSTWLKCVIGETWEYFDNNYSDQQVDEIYSEYDYYTNYPEEYSQYF